MFQINKIKNNDEKIAFQYSKKRVIISASINSEHDFVATLLNPA